MASLPTSVPADRRWRLPRFSLRTLFVVLTALCLLCGWWFNKALRQRAAVQRFYFLTADRQDRDLTTMGYRYRGQDEYYKPIIPKWLHPLRDLIGEEAFGEVTGVQLLDTAASNDDLLYLADVPLCERIWLSETRVTDEGILHLRACPKLRFLALNNTQITDHGLQTIAEFKTLESLSLDNTQVTDAGLVHLQSLPNLKELWLRGTGITDAGYRQLQAALPRCEIQASVPTYLHKMQFEYTGSPSRD